jgi:hypothetical protein
MAYIGPPALVADVVLWPDRSIIKQVLERRLWTDPADDCISLCRHIFALPHDLSARLLSCLQSYDARERIMDASLPQHLAHGNLNGERCACQHAASLRYASPENCSIVLMLHCRR